MNERRWEESCGFFHTNSFIHPFYLVSEGNSGWWFGHHSLLHYILYALHWSLVPVYNDKNKRWSWSSSSSSLQLLLRRRRKIHFPLSLSLSLSLSLFFILSSSSSALEERTSVYRKNVDRLECLSSHFRERMACTSIHVVVWKRNNLPMGAYTHTYTHNISRIAHISEWRKSAQWCNDVRTEENCVRERETAREGETQKVSEREEKRKRRERWELYKRQLVPSKKNAQDYASHSERTRKIERDQEKISSSSCCCSSHHYVKDRAHLRTYTRRFCLIFDTENVSSCSVPILLTLSAWISQRSFRNKKKKQTNKKVVLLYFVYWTNQLRFLQLCIYSTRREVDVLYVTHF